MAFSPLVRSRPKDDLEWGKFVQSATATPTEGEVTDDSFADRGGVSVIGRSSNSSGKPADILFGSDGSFLVRRGNSVTTGGIILADLPGSVATDVEVSAAIAALSTVYAPIQTTGTYTGAFTGTTSDPVPVIRWSLIGAQVMLYLPQNAATSNATSFTITGAPAAIRPSRAQTVLAIVRDNGTVSIGTASMSTGGTLTLGLGVSSGVFTNSGSKGVELQTLTYSRD